VPETAEERMRRLIPGKRYLGDGTYVQSAGWGTTGWGTTIDLTAENGIDVLHRIQLEPTAWRNLLSYMTDLEEGLVALLKEKEADEKENPDAQR
jgi:hypothetical protein